MVKKYKDGDTRIDGKKQIYEVYDEWEHMDIDRNEQREGIKRREKRWKEIEREIRLKKHLEKRAIENAEKMHEPPKTRQPNPIEAAWLRCDYVLYNIMTDAAYGMMEWLRIEDPTGYKHLYKIFMSRNMMENISLFVDFFAQGNTIPKRLPKSEVIKHYVKYRGYKPTIIVKHKGEEEYDL